MADDITVDNLDMEIERLREQLAGALAEIKRLNQGVFTRDSERSRCAAIARRYVDAYGGVDDEFGDGKAAAGRDIAEEIERG